MIKIVARFPACLNAKEPLPFHSRLESKMNTKTTATYSFVWRSKVGKELLRHEGNEKKIVVVPTRCTEEELLALAETATEAAKVMRKKGDKEDVRKSVHPAHPPRVFSEHRRDSGTSETREHKRPV